MKKLLKKLNKSIGIRGSLIITRDGVTVEASMEEHLNQDTIAALASTLLKAVSGSRAPQEIGDVTRFTMSSKHGRLIFEIMESLVLVVVTEKNIDLDITMLEIAGLAKRLQRMARISV